MIDIHSQENMGIRRNSPGNHGRSVVETALSVCILMLAFTVVGSRPSGGRLWRPAPGVQATPVAALPNPLANSGIGVLTGEERRVKVRPGETLLQIARRHNADRVSLSRLNRLSREGLTSGQTLRLPTLHIVPFAPQEGIVLNIPERGVYLFHEGRLQARYPVAIGARTWETPTGKFTLVRKVIDPAWLPPRAMVEREGIPQFRVPPGKTNPLGDRWMGWSAPEVGFHSTPQVETIGQYASHACVRLYPESAHALFKRVSVGTPIYAIYEPILLGKKGQTYYLSVSPDVYGKKPVSFVGVRKHLQKAGLLADTDWAMVNEILRRQDGYPYPITNL